MDPNDEIFVTRRVFFILCDFYDLFYFLRVGHTNYFLSGKIFFIFEIF